MAYTPQNANGQSTMANSAPVVIASNQGDAGLEIPGDGTLQFGITAAATYTTNAPTWDVLIFGYEY